MSTQTQTQTQPKTGNYNFHLDLAQAQKTEEEISQLLTNYGFSTIHFNNDNQYDLLLEKKGKEFKLEIKEDFRCGATGNVAVEYESRGKLSGILTSKSDLYMYKMNFLESQGGVKYYLMSKNALINVIKAKKYFRRVNGGDKGSNTMMYLFKTKELEAISVVI